MRYAIISDIHSNYEALAAVCEDIDKESVDQIICLGDIVGYGADPGRCIAEVKKRTAWVVAGNHDQAAIGKLGMDYFNLNARKAAEWTAKNLSADEKKYLASLPLSRNSQTPDCGFVTVHSSPDSPELWRYVLSADEAEYQFERFPQQICLIGHSHQPMFWQLNKSGECAVAGREYLHFEPDKRYIINVGSVGQPRDGDSRSCYAICDSERKELVIRRLEYNIALAQRKIMKAGLPPRLAERLAFGF